MFYSYKASWNCFHERAWNLEWPRPQSLKFGSRINGLWFPLTWEPCVSVDSCAVGSPSRDFSANILLAPPRGHTYLGKNYIHMVCRSGLTFRWMNALWPSSPFLGGNINTQHATLWWSSATCHGWIHENRGTLAQEMVVYNKKETMGGRKILIEPKEQGRQSEWL